ncbi:MAG: acyl carrier protein [Desulfosporosinus sp.]
MKDRVILTLKHVISNKTSKKITPESRLREDLNVDSIDFLMIIGDLEDEFSITIDEDDFLDVVTVNDIVEKLEARGLTRRIIWF